MAWFNSMSPSSTPLSTASARRWAAALRSCNGSSVPTRSPLPPSFSTAGALGDRIGAKRVFMAGFAIFTAASVGCALAPDATILIAARAVQGLGAAILVPNSLALLSHAYPDEKQRGRAVGIWAAGASLALTAGPSGRRRADRAGRLALDLSRQSADRSCRFVAELALCRRNHAITTARDRPAGPVRGDRRTGLFRRHDHRERRAGLEPSVRDRGIRAASPCWRCCSFGRSGARRNRCCRCRCSHIGCSR